MVKQSRVVISVMTEMVEMIEKRGMKYYNGERGDDKVWELQDQCMED